MNNFFLMKDYVDKIFSESKFLSHEDIALDFMKVLTRLSDEEFEKLIIVSGFIPDEYSHDSSEETLFSKLVEALLAVWVNRINLGNASLIKQKSNMEDVNIVLNNSSQSVIVADAKSFRLGRSQKAPNAKDFMKKESVVKWGREYEKHLGGFIVYPSTHEWSLKSEIYTYCTDKSSPILMLPYTYLAFLYNKRSCFNSVDFASLWKFQFASPTDTKSVYWESINAAICKITHCEQTDLATYLKSAETLLKECILHNIQHIEALVQKKKQSIHGEIESYSIEQLKEKYTEYKISVSIEKYLKDLHNIKEFRL